MGWQGFVLVAFFVVWVAVKTGPKKGERYLDWLWATLLLAAIGMLAQRLMETYGSGAALLWCLLFVGLGLLWEFRPGHRERRAARRAARRGTRARDSGDRSSAKS